MMRQDQPSIGAPAGLVDLAAERVGGIALIANDEFFAAKENLLKPGRGVFIPDKFTERGKWMDGWETMRRRSPRLEEEFDWCVVRLGSPGKIRGITVDTSFFRGNFPSHCSIDACSVGPNADVAELLSERVPWTEILSKAVLSGDTQNNFAIDHEGRATHVRLSSRDVQVSRARPGRLQAARSV